MTSSVPSTADARVATATGASTTQSRSMTANDGGVESLVALRVKHKRTTYFLEGSSKDSVLQFKARLMGMINPQCTPGFSVKRSLDGFEQRMPHTLSGIRFILPKSSTIAGSSQDSLNQPASVTSVPPAGAKGKEKEGKVAAVAEVRAVYSSSTGAPAGSALAQGTLLEDTQLISQLDLVPDPVLFAVFQIPTSAESTEGGKWEEVDIPKPDALEEDEKAKST